MWTSDPVWDAECYAAEQDRQTGRRPVCDCCGEPIQEDCALHYKGFCFVVSASATMRSISRRRWNERRRISVHQDIRGDLLSGGAYGV